MAKQKLFKKMNLQLTTDTAIAKIEATEAVRDTYRIFLNRSRGFYFLFLNILCGFYSRAASIQGRLLFFCMNVYSSNWCPVSIQVNPP